MLASDIPGKFPIGAAHVHTYLKRIGWPNNNNEQLPEPNLFTLEKILNYHIKAIPFGGLSLNYYTRHEKVIEPVINKLDPYSTRSISTDPLIVFDKLVIQKREGYCFEHNSLLRNILEYIGFECISTCARIFDPFLIESTGEEDLHDITHWINLVKLDDIVYLVDGGYFHHSLLRPIPVDFRAKPTKCEGKVTHRIVNDTYQDPNHISNSISCESYRLEVQYGSSNWKPVYTFSMKPYYQRDLEALNFFMVHSPDKAFAHHILVSKFVTNGYIAIVDDELTIRINGEKLKIIKLKTEHDRRKAYRKIFGIKIPKNYKEHLPTSFGSLSSN